MSIQINIQISIDTDGDGKTAVTVTPANVARSRSLDGGNFQPGLTTTAKMRPSLSTSSSRTAPAPRPAPKAPVRSGVVSAGGTPTRGSAVPIDVGGPSFARTTTDVVPSSS